MSSSDQFRNHVGKLGGDGDGHVPHIVDLLFDRIVEFEEKNHVLVLVKVLDSDFRCFRVRHLDEEGPRAYGVGDLHDRPVHVGIEVDQRWAQSL